MATTKQNLIAGALRSTKTSKKGAKTYTFSPCAYPEGKGPEDYVKHHPFDHYGKSSEAIDAAMDLWPEAGMDLDFMVEQFKQKITAPEYIKDRCEAHRAKILFTQDVRQYAARHKVSLEKAKETLIAKAKVADAAAAKAKAAKADEVLDPK